MERDLLRALGLALSEIACALAWLDGMTIQQRHRLLAIARALDAALEERTDDPAERRDYDG